MEMRELSPRFDKRRLNALLAEAGIRPEPGVSYWCGLFEGEQLLACGGYEGATIKCLAVEPARQGEALLNTVFSHLYTALRRQGAEEIFVFTKPENGPLFQSLGLTPLAEAGEAMLLTSNPERISAYIAGILQEAPAQSAPISAGAIVMNANPFTLGHRHLVEYAAGQCALLHVFVVEEEKSAFPFAARYALVQQGTADIPHVLVHQGGPYIISAATFPSYFLKDPGGAAPAHAALDATLFATRIAPPLHIHTRFVGEEPLDPLTELYNDTLQGVLREHGMALSIIPRKEEGHAPISASRVRREMLAGNYPAIKALVPETTYAYIQGEEGQALRNTWMQSK